jgi:HAMP domain-containing protein
MTKFAALFKSEQYASQVDVAFEKAKFSFQMAVAAFDERQTADAASLKARVATGTETDKWTMYCRLFSRLPLLVHFMWLVRSALKHPLESIISAAEKLAAGKFEVTIPEQSKGDEVGNMAGFLEE